MLIVQGGFKATDKKKFKGCKFDAQRLVRTKQEDDRKMLSCSKKRMQCRRTKPESEFISHDLYQSLLVKSLGIVLYSHINAGYEKERVEIVCRYCMSPCCHLIFRNRLWL